MDATPGDRAGIPPRSGAVSIRIARRRGQARGHRASPMTSGRRVPTGLAGFPEPRDSSHAVVLTAGRRGRQERPRAASASSIQVTLPGDRLQERAGDLGGHRAGQRAGDGLGLVGAEGEDQDRPGGQDRGRRPASGRGGGRGRLAAEVRAASAIVTGWRSTRRVGRRQGLGDRQVGRLVEADVAVAADAEELEVEAAVGGDPAVVVRRRARRRTPRARVPSSTWARFGARSTWPNRCRCM